jgi:hypothetical protein
MAIKISPSVREKLTNKHRVNEDEIAQCFANRTHTFLIDTRSDHLSNPMTRWFISETDVGRKLKVAFIPVKDDVHIRTAYEPHKTEIAIFQKVATPIKSD